MIQPERKRDGSANDFRLTLILDDDHIPAFGDICTVTVHLGLCTSRTGVVLRYIQSIGHDMTDSGWSALRIDGPEKGKDVDRQWSFVLASAKARTIEEDLIDGERECRVGGRG